MFTDIYWMSSLTMKEVFVVTGIGILLAGTALGVLIHWLFEKDNKEDE